jgi:hypothetical protein
MNRRYSIAAWREDRKTFRQRYNEAVLTGATSTDPLGQRTLPIPIYWYEIDAIQRIWEHVKTFGIGAIWLLAGTAVVAACCGLVWAMTHLDNVAWWVGGFVAVAGIYGVGKIARD